MPPTPAPQALDYAGWMQQGVQHHGAGRLESALIAFENALQLSPGDINATSANAALLTALSRPQAARRMLQSIAPQLMSDADGACNLAIAAETCGDLADAHAAYQKALQLDPTHLRSLTNIGLLAAGSAQWELATECAKKCVAIAPSQPAHHVQLADVLTGARHYDTALGVLRNALERFPDNPDVVVRQIVVLAFQGEFEHARTITASLGQDGLAALRAFLERLQTARNPDHELRPQPTGLPDALQLYFGQAFDAMTACDWRGLQKLTDVIRQALNDAVRSGQGRDMRDAQFFGLMLSLQEEELAQMRQLSGTAIMASVTALRPGLPPFTQRRATLPGHDGRLRVGLAVRSLHDPDYVQALQNQLTLHDHNRFSLHIYSPTRQPRQEQALPLRAIASSVVELAHMSHVEAAGRIRLDQLDIFVDMAFDSAWCRPEIPALRVAPVQIRQLTWHRHHPPQPCDYNLSDTFVHPDGLDLQPYGPIVRLPHTCWLAAGMTQAAASHPRRADAGLPDDAFVLCAAVHPANIDPQTFLVWMKIMRSLPDAVLWFPAYPLVTATNLVREAVAAGVAPARLLFAVPMSRADSLACMRHADLLLDPLRFGGCETMVDALRLGVPAISCAGNSMASRLGSSVLRAAGLHECIFESANAYVAQALKLGRQPDVLAALKLKVKTATPTSTLFDLRARIRELESAWTTMAERSRAGLPPATFDVNL